MMSHVKSRLLDGHVIPEVVRNLSKRAINYVGKEIFVCVVH